MSNNELTVIPESMYLKKIPFDPVKTRCILSFANMVMAPPACSKAAKKKILNKQIMKSTIKRSKTIFLEISSDFITFSSNRITRVRSLLTGKMVQYQGGEILFVF